jgi:outer membrane protein
MALKIQISFITLWLLSYGAFAQNRTYEGSQDAVEIFHSIDDLFDYTSKNSITLQNNEVRLEQAKKARLAAVLGTIDVNGSLLSAQFTDNTTLGVNLFPAEIFGGEPGTFQEVQMGVRYNTNLTNFADVKLVNPAGWKNLKLSKINIDLTASNNTISLKNLQENIANNYFNIVNLEEQIRSTGINLNVADTLAQITRHKYEEGLARQQDVNDTRVNYLQIKENLQQLKLLRDQYYISLKLLCDIPEQTQIRISHAEGIESEIQDPVLLRNQLTLKNSLLKEQYAWHNLQATKAAFMPTVSLQLSNSNNLYNPEFEPVTGNWINSNYIGLRLNIPIPNSQNISRRSTAKFDYEMAINNTQQARIKADLDQQSLDKEYQKALSQAGTNAEILALRKDTYFKNQNLYAEGLISLDKTITSFNEMVNAEYNLISAQVNVQLVLSKISINNNIQ